MAWCQCHRAGILSVRTQPEQETEKSGMGTMKRSIFRERAIQHYRRGHEKDVLPRFVAPPVFLGLWIVLGLCLVIVWLAWAIRIPVFTAALGTVVESGQADHPLAILFAPSDQLHAIHPGEAVQVQIGSTGPLLYSITAVAPTLVGPEEARQRYHLDGTLSLLITAPSVVMEVALNASISASNYAGSIVHAQIKVGEMRILSFLPILGQMIGG